MATEGYIYIIEDEKDICKVGFSKNYPDKRIAALATKFHRKFHIRAVFQSDHIKKHEREIHEILKDYRLRGEWFNISVDHLIKEMRIYFYIDNATTHEMNDEVRQKIMRDPRRTLEEREFLCSASFCTREDIYGFSSIKSGLRIL